MQLRVKIQARELRVECEVDGGDAVSYELEASDLNYEVELDGIVEFDANNGTLTISNTEADYDLQQFVASQAPEPTPPPFDPFGFGPGVEVMVLDVSDLIGPAPFGYLGG